MSIKCAKMRSIPLRKKYNPRGKSFLTKPFVSSFTNNTFYCYLQIYKLKTKAHKLSKTILRGTTTRNVKVV